MNRNDNNRYNSRFKRVRQLPISEELMGAYLEGNLEGAELNMVKDTIASDNYLSELAEDIKADLDSITPERRFCAAAHPALNVSASQKPSFGFEHSRLSDSIAADIAAFDAASTPGSIDPIIRGMKYVKGDDPSSK